MLLHYLRRQGKLARFVAPLTRRAGGRQGRLRTICPFTLHLLTLPVACCNIHPPCRQATLGLSRLMMPHLQATIVRQANKTKSLVEVQVGIDGYQDLLPPEERCALLDTITSKRCQPSLPLHLLCG